MDFLSLGCKAYNPKECVKIFNKAKESIKIIIPDVDIDFFWNDSIIKSLQKAVVRGVAVQIAYCASYDAGKIGILGVSGIEIHRIEKGYERLMVSVDAKCAVVEAKPRGLRKIEVGIISSDASLLAHEIDTLFDEAIIKR